MKKTTFLTYTILILSFINIYAQKSYVNPAAKYSEMLGYRYEIQNTKAGGEVGMVHLPDGQIVNAWDFYKGKIAQEFSYAAKLGFDVETEIVKKDGYTMERAVCVRSNKGVEERITLLELMELNGEPLNAEVQRTAPSIYEMATEDTTFKAAKSLPTAFDWRDYNGHAYIGDARDQGSCGSCYSFGAAAAAEGTYNYATGNYDGNVADFSEAYIAWCISEDNTYGSHFSGCNGADYDYMELEALTDPDWGIIPESYFPYVDANNVNCPSTASSAPKTIFKSWHRVASSNVDAIKTAIMKYGVVDAAVYVTSSFQSYSGGVWSDSNTSCSNGAYTTTNHAISLVGWGYDATEGDYWILRNSWGTSWGENGYMRISVNSAAVDCAVCYLTYFTISGPSTVCTSNNTFTLSNVPDGATVDWDCSNNMEIVTEDTSTCTVRALNSFVNGSGTVTATIYATGYEPVIIEKEVWVGTPNAPTSIDFMPINPYVGGQWVYASIRANNSPQANAIYQWDGGPHNLNQEVSDWSSIRFRTLNTQYWYSTIFRVSALNTCGTSFEYSKTLMVKEKPNGGGIIPERKENTPTEQFQIIDNVTKLVVKPNPANDYINVEIIDENFESGSKNKIYIKIFNSKSIPVFMDNSYQKTFRINTSNLSHGLYLLQVIYKGEKYSKQILVEH